LLPFFRKTSIFIVSNNSLNEASCITTQGRVHIQQHAHFVKKQSAASALSTPI